MVARLVFFFVSTVLVLSDASYVEPVRKCSSRDSDCLRSYFQQVVRGASKNGIPEIRLAPFDPTVIKNFKANITNYVELQMIDGVGSGGRSCVFNNFLLNIPKGYGAMDFVCDLEVEGHYKAFSDSSIVRKVLNGDVISGDGTGSVKLEKVRFVLEFPFHVVSRGGDYFLFTDFAQSKYSFNVLRGVTFAANHLYLGKEEASTKIINVMNQQWQSIIATTGSAVFEGIFKYIFYFGQTFFHSVPVKTFLLDDVSPYATPYSYRVNY